MRLHLIRHGKASPQDDDYDQLQPVGVHQARTLGAWLNRERQGFDAVYCGLLRRQQATLQHMREAAPQQQWPKAVPTEALAEAPFETLLKRCVIGRLAEDGALKQLVDQLAASADDASRGAAIELIFDHMLRLWRDDEVRLDGMETAVEFGARVRAVYDEILREQADAEDVAVVTSHGVIAWIVEPIQVDGYTPQLLFANTSVTCIDVQDGVARLVSSNRVEHLDPSEVTLL